MTRGVTDLAEVRAAPDDGGIVVVQRIEQRRNGFGPEGGAAIPIAPEDPIVRGHLTGLGLPPKAIERLHQSSAHRRVGMLKVAE